MKSTVKNSISILCLCALLAATGCGLTMKIIPAGEMVGRTDKDHFIRIDGVNYHYVEYPANGQKVVMIHGFSSSTYTWEKCAEIMQKQGYHVLALDMKGFGWSDKPRGAKYDPATLTQEVKKWIDSMGLNNFVLVGNSLGGAVAWGLALFVPEKIKSLVLIDAAGYKIKIPAIITVAKSTAAEPVMNLYFGKWMVKSTLKQVMYNDKLVTDEKINAYYDRMRSENALYAQIEVSRSIDFGKFEAITKRIPEIKASTLILWGKEDTWIPLESAYKFKNDIKGSKLVVIPQTGHIPMEEKPDIVSGLIMRFIEKKPIEETEK